MRNTYAKTEHKPCQASERARQRQFAAGDGAFDQHVAPEAEQLGGPPCRAGGHLAGFLDQRLLLDQAAEILLVQAQARQNAGIDIALQYVDSGTYSSRQKDGQYGIIPNSTTTQENGVTIYFHYLPRDKGGSINYSRTEAPEVSAWLEAGASTLDPKKRFEIYAELQRFALLEQAYGLPLYVPDDQIVAAARVKGIGFRPFKRLPENAYDIWLQG